MSKRLVVEKSGNATLVLSNGELQWDYVTNRLRVHDGTTAGGKTAIQMYSSGFSYVFPTPLVGFSWTSPTESILYASDAQADDNFGAVAAISGDANYAIVGAPGEDTGGSSAGAAYIFVRDGSTWAQQQKIQSSDIAASDSFGRRVSISTNGDYALVSAPIEGGTGTQQGAAYVFTRSGSTWTQQAKLQASDKQDSDQFGYGSAISGDGSYAIIGAHFEDGNGSNAGKIYIFSRTGSTWSEQRRFTASGGEANDRYGYAVSISDDGSYAMAGAWLEDGGSGNPLSGAGGIYFYSRSGSTWSTMHSGAINADDAAASDGFGEFIQMSGDGQWAIVGSVGEDTGDTSGNGAAYIFKRDGTSWTQHAKLLASDKAGNMQLGESVGINYDGTYAIAGARNMDGQGAAYIWKREEDTWTEVKKLQASDAQSSDWFGVEAKISADGDYVIVGAQLEDTGGTSAGAAYIYEAG